MGPNVWDVRVFLRAAGAALGALAVAWLVTAATDEGGVEWGERTGRTLPVAPLCALLGVSAALAPARWRGEARALAALGRSRLQVAGSAVAGAAIAATTAGAFALLGQVDVAGFYPAAPHASVWRWDGHAFLDARRARMVMADGSPHRLVLASAEAWSGSLPAHARVAAAVTTVLAGLALALLAAHALLARSAERRLDRGERLLIAAVLGAMAVSVGLFQAAAAGLVSSLTAPLPAVALLALAVQRYRTHP